MHAWLRYKGPGLDLFHLSPLPQTGIYTNDWKGNDESSEGEASDLVRGSLVGDYP